MKVKLFLTIILGVLLSSCVNELDSELETIKEGNVPIQFAAKISSVNTRVVDNIFEIGDKVGLYATIANSPLTYNRYIDNLSLVYSTNNSLIPSREVFYPEGDHNLDFYAYFPYQTDIMESGTTTIPVSVQKDQSSDSNFSSSDFLVSHKENVKNGSSKVTLDFKHKLSKISIQIVFEDENSAIEALHSNPSILATDFYTQAIYNISNDSFQEQQSLANIIPHGDWILNGQTLLGKELLVVPQDIEKQTLILDIAGRIYFCILDSKDLTTGNQYVFKINSEALLEGTLNSVKATISKWEDGEEQSAETNKELSTILIESLSFSTSNIYHVHSSGMPVAEICKEYLYKEGELDSRAIVAYPIENGVTNLEKGFVLQLLDEEADVHGGSLSWNRTTNDFTYTSGNSAPIQKIYINENKEISTSSINALTINVSSYVIRDMRSGALQKYPIVKIATQYWMREDLHTSHYSNGTQIKAITTLDGTAGYAKNSDATHYYYTGEAVETGLLAPDAWKVPSSTDWEKLIEYLGNNTDALKDGEWEEFSGHPYYPGNDKTGFNMHAAGVYVELDGIMTLLNTGTCNAYWMVTNQQNQLPDEEHGYQFLSYINTFKAASGKVKNKEYYNAFSVRCIKE